MHIKNNSRVLLKAIILTVAVVVLTVTGVLTIENAIERKKASADDTEASEIIQEKTQTEADEQTGTNEVLPEHPGVVPVELFDDPASEELSGSGNAESAELPGDQEPSESALPSDGPDSEAPAPSESGTYVPGENELPPMPIDAD